MATSDMVNSSVYVNAKLKRKVEQASAKSGMTVARLVRKAAQGVADLYEQGMYRPSGREAAYPLPLNTDRRVANSLKTMARLHRTRVSAIVREAVEAYADGLLETS